MKVFLWILVVLAVTAATAGVIYLLQKQRAAKAEKGGVAVYATLISAEPVKALGRESGIMAIKMWLQEPGKPAREVTLRSRVQPGQKFQAGMKLGVVVDPKDPRRVYPAGPEAMKRMQLTGSRAERRFMQKKGM